MWKFVFKNHPDGNLYTSSGEGDVRKGESSVHKWVISASSFIKNGINNIAVFAENMKNTELTMLLRREQLFLTQKRSLQDVHQNSNANDTASHLFFRHTSVSIVQDKVSWNSALTD